MVELCYVEPYCGYCLPETGTLVISGECRQFEHCAQRSNPSCHYRIHGLSEERLANAITPKQADAFYEDPANRTGAHNVERPDISLGITDNDLWCSLVHGLAHTCHQEAVAHGFYPEGTRNEPECIALMHSELSEALEGMRHGNGPSTHIPAYTQVEEELADCIIRILDYEGWKGLRLAEAVLAKMAYNKTRPHLHGKEF